MAEDILGRRCATHDLGSGDVARMVELERDFRARSRIAESTLQVTIPVRFIHIVSGAQGVVTRQQREDQIAVMNAAFAPAGVSFSHDEAQVSEIDNAAFFAMGHGSAAERQCKSQTQAIAPEQGLNFYTARPGGGLLGWATFPHEMAGDPVMDGVVMLDGTLPGGATADFNKGKTAVHEVGHWLGLWHTFQGGCFPPGDEVADTPAHSGPNFGKPADSGQPYNRCPSEPSSALCPIHNYMNYVDDDWMTEFTDGQIQRIWAQIGMFRSRLLQPGVSNVRESALAAPVVW
ncbi:zinc metalloprotease [Paracoccus spongiarum]|uniref:Zinc metalloprotease n=1 Tax=Paracoccus spongiarum TaxID=3064387 RepID=A0ABT9JBZ1_9RHOB|nr:zinc metalloprotease [Paracoccus sp. 2205BS29-5]MDP5306662.1 zinc metalloprotease [Paracoccus sp. 2205BS29-5]